MPSPRSIKCEHLNDAVVVSHKDPETSYAPQTPMLQVERPNGRALPEKMLDRHEYKRFDMMTCLLIPHTLY